MNRIQTRMAQDFIDQWRSEGAPYWITAYEAHSLTGGIVGVARGLDGAAKPMHLVQVASLLAKRSTKAVR